MPKLEYVISLRLSEKQEKLYQLYLETECGDSEDRRRRLFAHYYNFSRIFSHPFQLVIHQEEKATFGFVQLIKKKTFSGR